MNSFKTIIFLAVSMFLIPMSPMAARTDAYLPELGVRVEYARTDSGTWAAIWLDIRKEYYAYAHEPGPTGKPTTLTVHPASSASGNSAFPVYYPKGREQKDTFDPSLSIRAYAGHAPLFVDLSGAEPGRRLEGTLDMLLCSDKHCLPIRRTVALELPTSVPPPMDSLPAAPFWREAVQGLPAPPFSPASETKTGAPVTQDDARRADRAAETGPWLFVPRPMEEFLEVAGLGKALFLGLLAGLLLNAMPCVLPVLTLKASALLVMGEGDAARRLRRFREHNLLFAAGILTQFLLLAIVLGTAGLIWGQLFQSTALVTGVLVVVFLLALSMLGLFTLPIIDLKAGSARTPRLNAYLTGILSTLLATPCSGPLLGGVLAWAFTQPYLVLSTVFLAVGAGMSLPYLFLALRPELAGLLPRPGPWMAILEKGVGFFLLGVCLYLLSILPQDRRLPLLCALLLTAVCGWIWGRFGGWNASPMRRTILGAGLAAFILAAMAYAARPPEPPAAWLPFTQASFREILGKEAILAEFTADWCPNCKFLERTVLTPDRLRRWQREYGITLVRVDLTRDDPAAADLLRALGSGSIPLTALFPPGLAASSPVVIRDIYSLNTLEKALRKAFRAD